MPNNRTIYTKQVAPGTNQSQPLVLAAPGELLNTRSIRILNIEASYTGATTGDTIRLQVQRTPSNTVLCTFEQPGSTTLGGSLVRNFIDGMRFTVDGSADTGFRLVSDILVAASGAAGGTIRSHTVNASFCLD